VARPLWRCVRPARCALRCALSRNSRFLAVFAILVPTHNLLVLGSSPYAKRIERRDEKVESRKCRSCICRPIAHLSAVYSETPHYPSASQGIASRAPQTGMSDIQSSRFKYSANDIGKNGKTCLRSMVNLEVSARSTRRATPPAPLTKGGSNVWGRRLRKQCLGSVAVGTRTRRPTTRTDSARLRRPAW